MRVVAKGCEAISTLIAKISSANFVCGDRVTVYMLTLPMLDCVLFIGMSVSTWHISIKFLTSPGIKISFVGWYQGSAHGDCISSVVMNCPDPGVTYTGRPCTTVLARAPENSAHIGLMETVMGTMLDILLLCSWQTGIITKLQLLCLTIESIGTALTYGTIRVAELLLLKLINWCGNISKLPNNVPSKFSQLSSLGCFSFSTCVPTSLPASPGCVYL